MWLSPLIGYYLKKEWYYVDTMTRWYLKTWNYILMVLLCCLLLGVIWLSTRIPELFMIYHMLMSVLVCYSILHICILYTSYIQSEQDIDTFVDMNQKSQRWLSSILIIGLTFNIYILLVRIILMISLPKISSSIDTWLHYIYQSYQNWPEERCMTQQDKNNIPKIIFSLLVIVWIGFHVSVQQRNTLLMWWLTCIILIYKYWISHATIYIPIVSDVYTILSRQLVK